MTSDTQTLKGTVALVTGASSGIGEATALELAGVGATLALAARRVDRLEDLVRRIEQKGGRAIAVEADVSRREQAEAMVERTVSELGRLDVLVNNAGVMLLGTVEDSPLDEWETMIDVNIKGLLYCARAALPHLVAAASEEPRRVADIVNLSSVAGRIARAGNAVYNLTKHGVGAFSEALRQELATRHVRVAAIEPGATSTELQGHNRPEVQEQIRERFSDIELLRAQDIAQTIAFVVTRPWHATINEVMVRPTEQAG